MKKIKVMRTIKRFLTMILTLLVIISFSININAFADEEITKTNEKVGFTDVKPKDWFYENVNKMTELGIVNGYTDGTFRPQDAVQADEFIKMVIVGMGYQLSSTTSTYWADGFIQKAEELKIVDKTFINDYRNNLTRQQAAKIINNILNLKETRPAKTYDEYIITAIKDYHEIESKYVQDVIDIYAYGIMQGDELGYIKPSKTITRAETTAVILRMMNKDERLSLDKLSADTNSIKLIDAEGVEHIVVAPILDGEPVTEIIEVARLYVEASKNTKGCDDFGYNSYSNYIGVTGFENQRKVDYINSLKDKYELSNEELTKMAMYMDFNFGMSLIELRGKYKPYRFVTNKDTSWLDDETYKNKVGKWEEYFTEYYLDSFKPVFKYLFEDDFDEAWGYFTTALNYTGTRQTVSKVLNERYFDILYSNTGIQMTISLKNQYK